MGSPDGTPGEDLSYFRFRFGHEEFLLEPTDNINALDNYKINCLLTAMLQNNTNLMGRIWQNIGTTKRHFRPYGPLDHEIY